MDEGGGVYAPPPHPLEFFQKHKEKHIHIYIYICIYIYIYSDDNTYQRRNEKQSPPLLLKFLKKTNIYIYIYIYIYICVSATVPTGTTWRVAFC